MYFKYSISITCVSITPQHWKWLMHILLVVLFHTEICIYSLCHPYFKISLLLCKATFPANLPFSSIKFCSGQPCPFGIICLTTCDISLKSFFIVRDWAGSVSE